MKERAMSETGREANSASWTLKRIASVEGIVAVGMAKATTTNRVGGVGQLKGSHRIPKRLAPRRGVFK
ncbi:hypothetical protein ACW2AE_05375 [Limosilactobacillus fermentum]